MIRPLCHREPQPEEQAPHFHTHERPPAFHDGLADARNTLNTTGTSHLTMVDLLDVAWAERNRAAVTSSSYDYWAAHLTVYREAFGITPERDFDRQSRRNV